MEIKNKVVYKKLTELSLLNNNPRVISKENIDKAKEFLKWQPNIKLNEGLIKTIEYYRNAK